MTLGEKVGQLAQRPFGFKDYTVMKQGKLYAVGTLKNGDIRLCLTLSKSLNATMGMSNGYFCVKTDLMYGEQILYFAKQ